MAMTEENISTGQSGYISLANKYRPQSFEEVVGQESVSTTLKNAIKSGRIAHAYLFYGPRGCGKTTTARILAKALNCTGGGNGKPTPNPCGKCPQCLEIASSSDMDVLELDAASNTQVEKVREAIIDTVALAAGRDRYKVFILDEVHMLSSSSFNALLKTIEEPPAHVVFILATTELHKVPLTISSRCQTFRFKPITEEEISAHLLDLAGAENIELDEEAASIIAKSAGGALRDALTIFDRAIAFSGGKVNKDLVSQMLGILPQDLVKDSIEAIVDKDGARLHGVFEKVRAEGFDSLSLLKDIKNAFGEIFYLSLNSGKEPYPGAKEVLKRTAPSHIAALTRKISKLADEVKFSDTPALAAEVGLFTVMQNSIDIDSLIARLEALEQGSVTVESEKKSLNDTAASACAATLHKSKTFDEIKREIFSSEAPAMPKAAEVLRKTPAPAEKIEQANNSEEIKALPLNEKTSPAPLTLKDNPLDFSSPLEVWPSFKQELEENYPFVCEAVKAAKVSFPQKDEWTFAFRERDSFLRDIIRNRMSDLEKTALKLCGRKIKFKLILSPHKEDDSLLKDFAPAAEKEKSPLPTPSEKEPSAKAVNKDNIISREEAFLDGDYSECRQNEAVSDSSAGPKVNEILDIFDGQIING